MKKISQERPIRVVGIELRTSNDEAFETIPKFWQKILSKNVLSKIPNKISEIIYAIYTNFENEGKNNKGTYSLIVGAEVREWDKNNPDFVETVIMPQTRAVFPVEKGHPEKVGEVWQEIWNTELPKTFISDFEVYYPSGEIEIQIGIK